MTHAAVLLFALVYLAAYVVGHLLTIVLTPVPATSAAFLLGIFVAVFAGRDVWRWVRRVTR